MCRPFRFSLLVLSILGCLAINLSNVSGEESVKVAAPALTADNFEEAVQNVATALGPTVVSIRTEKSERYRVHGYFSRDPMTDDFFEKFFEDFFGEVPYEEFKRFGMGSGVIIDAQGYILTNEHVVGGADKILVTLSNGQQYVGTMQGTDPRSDLAVIKINAPDLPAAPLGNSDDLKIGQWVVAIGNPFGYLLSSPEPTVTSGVVSALHRSLPRTSKRNSDYSDLIQTDAAINPGNSGGPLVNLKGEVIGVNVAIFSTSGGYQGIGFAIPINTAQRIVKSLIAGEEVVYGWIGVSVQDISPQLSQYFGLSSTEGVVVLKALSNGPAGSAGVQEGDIILKVNDIPIKNVHTLTKSIGDLSAGEKAVLTIWRNKKEIGIPVTIGQRPDIGPKRLMKKAKTETKNLILGTEGEWRGMTVEDIGELSDQLQSRNIKGVIVTSVSNDSPSEKAGLQKGDIIISINKETIENVGDFHTVTQDLKGDCLIKTLRGYVVIKETF